MARRVTSERAREGGHRPPLRDEPFYTTRSNSSRYQARTERRTSPEGIIESQCERIQASLLPRALESIQERFYSNKLVLCFEGAITNKQAEQWLELYNQQHTHQIDLYEPLTNALFVVTVKDQDTTQAVRALLASSPLSLAEKKDERATQANLANKSVNIEDRFVAVNSYIPNFDPEHPYDFKHLVTIQITKGDPFWFFALDALMHRVGFVARRHLGSGTERHKIIALAETKKRKFPPEIDFSASTAQVVLVPIEIIDKQPRCYRCFSNTHRASNCFKLVGAAPRGRQSLYPEGGTQRREGWSIRRGSRSENVSYERQEERRYTIGERGTQNTSRTPLTRMQKNPISEIRLQHRQVSREYVTPGPLNGARVDISDPSPEEVANILARREIGVEHPEDAWKLALFQAAHLHSTYLRDKQGKEAATRKGKRAEGEATSKDSSSEINSAEPIEEDSPIRFEGGPSGGPGRILEATGAKVRREEEQVAYLKQQQLIEDEVRRAQDQKQEQEQALRAWQQREAQEIAKRQLQIRAEEEERHRQLRQVETQKQLIFLQKKQEEVARRAREEQNCRANLEGGNLHYQTTDCGVRHILFLLQPLMVQLQDETLKLAQEREGFFWP
ncbi:unnamed protein product [Calypogeia fissa]